MFLHLWWGQAWGPWLSGLRGDKRVMVLEPPCQVLRVAVQALTPRLEQHLRCACILPQCPWLTPALSLTFLCVCGGEHWAHRGEGASPKGGKADRGGWRVRTISRFWPTVLSVSPLPGTQSCVPSAKVTYWGAWPIDHGMQGAGHRLSPEGPLVPSLQQPG